MSYDVSFKAKLEGVDQWVYVGAAWISHSSNTGAMIKEVCGSYPSQWYGKKCADMVPILEAAVNELRTNPDKYKQYEAGNGWGTVETTAGFLNNILKNCKAYPTAVLIVDY